MTENSVLSIGTNIIKNFKDVFLLGLILCFVLVSLPVTIMGKHNVVEYFFSSPETSIIEISSGCLSQKGACSISLDDDIQMTLFMPSKVHSTLPFNVNIHIYGINAEFVTIMFKGVEHSHGRIRPLSMKALSINEFETKGILGYCGYGTMDWLAIVTIQEQQKTYKVTVPFQSIDLKPKLVS